MRQQYHSRDVGGEHHVWDVNRLVLMAETLPAIEVPLFEFKEIDETYWYQEGALPTCRSVAEHARLIYETDLAYPVLLCSEGRVIDGMHRICKALMEGRSSVTAKRFETTPKPDYINVRLEELPYDA